jgi:tetratricopeptide (TPR) repeat protein
MATTEHIDRLLDAIELIQLNRRDEALHLLREIIREDNDFEDAWLWMSVVVGTLDQSSICLDNVLRINPNNGLAAGALYRLRASEIAREERRRRYKLWRDTAFALMWLVTILSLFAVMISSVLILP